MSLPKIGDRINNYRLEELIGTGTFGQVWRARHHVLDETVAIKTPNDPQYVQNLRREGVVIHGLRHPNIVRVLDLDPYGDPPYMIMELVPGDSLRKHIDAHPDGMPPESAVALMRGVVDGLIIAHGADVLHRDIKPANLLVTHRVGEAKPFTSQSIKVADFGLGQVGCATTQSVMQSANSGASISGTLAYMAPEVKEGGDVDARSDLYSCGIVLFEMVTGKRPHGAEFPSSLRPELPEHIDEVFRRCYVRREHRFVDASAMRQALSPGVAAPARPVEDRERDQLCPSCRGRIEGDDQFCIRCGYQVVTSVPRCSSCDAYVHRSDRFCIGCGNDLRLKVS